MEASHGQYSTHSEMIKAAARTHADDLILMLVTYYSVPEIYGPPDRIST